LAEKKLGRNVFLSKSKLHRPGIMIGEINFLDLPIRRELELPIHEFSNLRPKDSNQSSTDEANSKCTAQHDILEPAVTRKDYHIGSADRKRIYTMQH
jgi:hypothetical protein